METVYANDFSDLSRLMQSGGALDRQASDVALNRLLGALQQRQSREDQLRDRANYMDFLRDDLTYKRGREDEIALRQQAQDTRREQARIAEEQRLLQDDQRLRNEQATQMNAVIANLMRQRQAALGEPDAADQNFGQVGPWSNPMNWLKNINPLRYLLRESARSRAETEAAAKAAAIDQQIEQFRFNPATMPEGVVPETRGSVRRMRALPVDPGATMVPVTPGPDGGLSTRVQPSVPLAQLQSLAQQAQQSIASGADPAAVRKRFFDLTGMDLP